MNYFAPMTAAKRYRKGRPFFHPLIINRIRTFLSLNDPLDRAVDVGCGTGLSAVALRSIAAQVTGIDAAREMIALAPKIEGIHYLLARAEHLPLRDDLFDLMTLSQVFHWLDPMPFFAEARRVLQSGGWIVAYDHYLTGKMEGSDDFNKWFRESYKARYPSTLRAWTSFEKDEVEREGFRLVVHEWLQNAVRFSPESLADYFLSQSNVIAAVEGGSENATEVKAWIMESIEPFFAGASEAEFKFDAPVWLIQKV